MANGLAALIAKSKESKDEPVQSTDSGTSAATALDSADVQQSPDVQSKAEAPANPSSGRRNPFGSSGTGASQPSDSGPRDSDGTGAATSSESTGGDRPKLAGLKLGSASSAKQLPSGDAGKVDAAPRLSLESLSESTDEGIAPVAGSGFADETPATKPTRELPEDLPKEQLNFIDSIDSVYEVLHDPELLGGVVRNILMELKNNPEYIKLLQPEDIRQMIRGMRESMGLARIKKTEAKAKRSGGAGKKALADPEMMDELDAILSGDLGKLLS